MPTEYDAKVLQEYADALYERARRIVLETAFRYRFMTFLISGVLLGLLFSFIAHQSRANEGPSLLLSVVVLTAIGIAAGVSEGRRKAFSLKLEAQQLLCQRQIEINTRPMA